MYKIIFILLSLWYLMSKADGHLQHVAKLAPLQSRTANKHTYTGVDEAREILDTPRSSNHSRVKRKVNSPPIKSMEQLTSANKLSSCAVLDNKCSCYTDPKTNRASINCRYEYLYDIPRFQVLDVIYYQISFSESNYITSIPDNAFLNLKVERIDLLKNQLKYVQSGAFNGLGPYLQELLIEGSGDMSQEIPFASMVNLTKLRRLTLKNFRLDNLMNPNYFRFFPILEEMSFTKLSLQHIDRDAFKDKLTNLQTVYFDDVKLSNIPVESLSHLNSLQKLYILNTRITTVYSRSFETMRNLEDLNLSHNLIQKMEKDTFIGISHKLRNLDLSSNELQPECLEALSSRDWRILEHLDLSYNEELMNIPENVFRFMPNLQYLHMVNINLNHISRNMFTGLENLFALDLSWNNIQTIQDSAFFKLNKMNQLIMNHQFKEGTLSINGKLELMPTQFKGLEQSLVTLDLEGTKLKALSFWSTVSTLTELKELRIGETGLKDIPNFAFAKNTKLDELSLDKNGITYLNQAAFKGLEGSLQDIKLNNNNLTTISHCVFEHFTGLQLIHLADNPLYCDCRIRWLHTMIHEINPDNLLFFKDEFKCSKPTEYAGHLLYDIPDNELTCSTDIPEPCTTQTTSKTTGRTSEPTTMPSVDNELKLTIASMTSHSITVAWGVTDKSKVTGYKLEFKLTTQPEMSKVIHIHRSEITHILYNLQPGTFYYICVTAEILQQTDPRMKECTTAQTLGTSNDSDKQQDNNNNSGYGESRNITIAVIIATTAAVVLIIVGVCAVVKYKVQKIKEVGRTLERMHTPYDRQYYDGSKLGKCATPNEYSDIEDAMIACKYQAKSPRNVQRQFGVDNQAFEYNSEMNPYQYGTYHKVGFQRKGRKNPYENDDEDDIEQVSINDDSTVHYKSDLVERHSAPSRLDAKDLKKQYDRNSRPLPATPAEQNKQKRCSTLKPVKKGTKTGKQETVVTLATVHDKISKD